MVGLQDKYSNGRASLQVEILVGWQHRMGYCQLGNVAEHGANRAL